MPRPRGSGHDGIAVLAVIAVGAMLLAVLFGQLTKRVPNSDGGVYAYAATNSATSPAISWDGATGSSRGPVTRQSSRRGSSTSTPSSRSRTQWHDELEHRDVRSMDPAIINLTGVRQMAWFQNVTVVLKFLPLLFVGVVGWFFVAKANFGPFNASGGSLYNGIASPQEWRCSPSLVSKRPRSRRSG